jgi:hypothetical protein
MARISWKTWPLVEVDVVGSRDQDGLEAMLGALAGGLDRGEPFAVIVTLDAAAARAHAYREGGGVELRKQHWLRMVRFALARRCRGIAYVICSSELVAGQTRALSASRRAFGCPAEAFDSAAAARAWVRGRLAGAASLTA